jgi:hypothetical protein
MNSGIFVVSSWSFELVSEKIVVSLLLKNIHLYRE